MEILMAPFPEVGLLVFPALDWSLAQISGYGVSKQKNMAKSMNSVPKHWDKTATAKYVGFHLLMTYRRQLPPDCKGWQVASGSRSLSAERPPCSNMLPDRTPSKFLRNQSI